MKKKMKFSQDEKTSTTDEILKTRTYFVDKLKWGDYFSEDEDQNAGWDRFCKVKKKHPLPLFYA